METWSEKEKIGTFWRLSVRIKEAVDLDKHEQKDWKTIRGECVTVYRVPLLVSSLRPEHRVTNGREVLEPGYTGPSVVQELILEVEGRDIWRFSRRVEGEVRTERRVQESENGCIERLIYLEFHFRYLLWAE